VLALMRREAAPDTVRVETPTQNLESYFLGVVNRARAAAQTTSGATAGNRVAEYLRPDADTAAASKVLERLTQSPPVAPSASPASQPIQPDEQRLAALTQPETAPVVDATKSTPVLDDTAALKQAENKLSSLINPPKP